MESTLFKNVENDNKKDNLFIMKRNDAAKNQNIAAITRNLAPLCK